MVDLELMLSAMEIEEDIASGAADGVDCDDVNADDVYGDEYEDDGHSEYEDNADDGWDEIYGSGDWSPDMCIGGRDGDAAGGGPAGVRKRRELLCVACLVWSTSTGSIAFSRRFWQVALARIGQAISDASCNSFATTILREHFGPAVIGSAVGVYFSGLYAGFSLSLASGNFFEEKLGWKWAYLVAGMGGIVIAVLAYLTIPEPPSLSGTADPRSSPAERGSRACGGQVASLATVPGAAENPGRHAATRRSATSDGGNDLERNSVTSPLIPNRTGQRTNLRYCEGDAKANSGRHDSGEEVDGYKSRDAVEADENGREENGQASNCAEGQRGSSERVPLRSERSSIRRRWYETSSCLDASGGIDGNPNQRRLWPLKLSPTIRSKLFGLSGVWLGSPSLLLVCLAGGVRDAGGYVFGYYLATYFSPLFGSNDSLTSDAPCLFSFNRDFDGDQVCNEDYPWCVDGSCNEVTSSPWHNIGMSTTDLAWFVSWVPLVAGSMGAMIGGFISDRFAEVYGTSGRLWVTTVSNALASPLSVGVLLAPYPWCFFCLFGSQLLGEMWIGVVITVVMELVPRHVRTTSVALYNFIITNLSGLATTLVPLLASWFDVCHVFEIMAAPLAGDSVGGSPVVSIFELDYGCRGFASVDEERGPAFDGLGVVDHADAAMSQERVSFQVIAKGSHGLQAAMLILYPGFYLISSVLCMVAALVLHRDEGRSVTGEDDGVGETSQDRDPGRDEVDPPKVGAGLVASGASTGNGQNHGSDLRGAGISPQDAAPSMGDSR